MPSALSWPVLVPYAPAVLRRRLPWALGHMKEAPSQLAWEWAMRFLAVGTVAAAIGAYVFPNGITRTIAFFSLPLLAVMFFYARKKARPNEDFQDTPWGA